jgi:hypothetical protein
MQDLGDVIVCCLIQLWVGHVHLNKHSSNVSLLGRLWGVHGLLFYLHIEKKRFLLSLSFHVKASIPFIFTNKGVIDIFIYELISYQR